jgi:antibiotic biosynthesis monooxygenase (ABM) superfamily enzyme
MPRKVNGSSMTHTNAPTRFSRPRFALLVLLGAYPTITAILYVVVPLTSGWSIWQRTLLVAPAMVAAMVWGVIPVVQQRFRTFINPSAARTA